jgi:uncharacterized protein YjbJ (UPF0337 family)
MCFWLVERLASRLFTNPYAILMRSTRLAHRILIPHLRHHHTPALSGQTNQKIKEIIMTNSNQDMNKTEPADKALKLNAKIKEVWSKLSDDDIKLYAGNKDQFFAKLKEKQNVSREDAEKQLQGIETSCATACSTEKPGAVKAA